MRGEAGGQRSAGHGCGGRRRHPAAMWRGVSPLLMNQVQEKMGEEGGKVKKENDNEKGHRLQKQYAHHKQHWEVEGIGGVRELAG